MTYTTPTGIKLVSTPDTCGGQWRLDGHRLTTALLADLADAEAARHNSLEEGFTQAAQAYGITVDQVEAAWWFETTLGGQRGRLEAALDEMKAAVFDTPLRRAIDRFVVWLDRKLSRRPS